MLRPIFQLADGKVCSAPINVDSMLPFPVISILPGLSQRKRRYIRSRNLGVGLPNEGTDPTIGCPVVSQDRWVGIELSIFRPSYSVPIDNGAVHGA